MATDVSQRAQVRQWFDRITSAEKYRKKTWETRFRPDELERYWEGDQWERKDDEALRPDAYVVNLFFGSIQSTSPTLLFHTPRVRCTAVPSVGEDFGSTLDQQAQLCQDTVQTYVDRKSTAFVEETTAALHDAFFRYGIIEWGYSANWMDNPNADKPVLKGDTNDPMLVDGKPITQPKKVPTPGSERVWVKHIPSQQFVVSASSHRLLERNDWVGYWEWVYANDLKANTDYDNTASIKAYGQMRSDLRTDEKLDKDELERRHGMVRLWKVWDLRKRTKSVMVEGHEKFMLKDEPFTVFPFAALKFIERSNTFYPLPLPYNWTPLQDELNESREMQRRHRKRYVRRYQARKDAFVSNMEELDKLKSTEDGAVILTTGAPGEEALRPIQDAALDSNIWGHNAEIKQDFTLVSGQPGEQRGLPQAGTATQANIINQGLQVRQSADRMTVAKWLGRICAGILEVIRTQMALDLVIQTNVDPEGEAAAEEAMTVATLWRRISAADLGELPMDVTVDLASLSPVVQEAQKAAWDEMLVKLTNPNILNLVSKSPYLLRRTLQLSGVRSETDIRQIMSAIQQEALMQQMQQAAMVEQGSKANPRGEASPPSEVMPQAGMPAGMGSVS